MASAKFDGTWTFAPETTEEDEMLTDAGGVIELKYDAATSTMTVYLGDKIESYQAVVVEDSGDRLELGKAGQPDTLIVEFQDDDTIYTTTSSTNPMEKPQLHVRVQ